ncbi:unnamed protein product [Oreochromis niloticus]|nr:unnamed protein product [Mustela putorius furo]
MGNHSLLFGLVLGVLLPLFTDQKIITAESGQDVNLTCRAPNNIIFIVEWSRADLGNEHVAVFKDKELKEDDQHPSFKNRVDLQDKQMKDGNVSLILKNVTAADSGTYMCCIVMAGTTSCPPISNITLSVVDPPGQPGGHTEDGGKEDEGKEDEGKEDGGKEDEGKEDGSVGLKAGLAVAVIVAAVVVGGVFIYRKRKRQKQSSYQPPVEFQSQPTFTSRYDISQCPPLCANSVSSPLSLNNPSKEGNATLSKPSSTGNKFFSTSVSKRKTKHLLPAPVNRKIDVTHIHAGSFIKAPLYVYQKNTLKDFTVCLPRGLYLCRPEKNHS